MSGVVVWMGPVSTANLSSVPLPDGWSILTISQEVVAPGRPAAQGLTPTDFRSYAASLGASPIDALLAKAGGAESCVLASFSAGHGLLDPLLSAQGGDERILGVYAADSYYGLDVKAGYKKHADACALSGQKFWLSTSGAKGGVTIHSGSESAAVFASAEGLAAVGVPAGMPLPADKSLGRGGVLWLDYGSRFSHGDHATKLCPMALSLWFRSPGGIGAPWDVSGSAPPSGPGDGTSPMAALATITAGGLLGYYGYRWAKKAYQESRRHP